MIAGLNRFFTRLTDHPDLGKLILRATFAILMLFHGIHKVDAGIGWISNSMVSYGLPAFIGYGVYIGEVVAPVLVLLGIFTRPAALVMSLTLVVAVLMVGIGKFFTLTGVGAWGLETEALYFFGGLMVMFLGSGRFSVMKNPDYR